jgi:hypothetical protein
MRSMGIVSQGRRTVVLAVVAALTLALTIGLVNVSESSARYAQAVVAKKKCKKGKKSAVAAKKCKRKKPAPVVVPAPPTPLALTDSEVINRVIQKAGEYCFVDLDCINYGYYSLDLAGTQAECSSKSTYSWTCYGFNEEDGGADPDFFCDFREVVERDGYNGIKSHQDLSFGIDGWECEA